MDWIFEINLFFKDGLEYLSNINIYKSKVKFDTSIKLN